MYEDDDDSLHDSGKPHTSVRLIIIDLNDLRRRLKFDPSIGR